MFYLTIGVNNRGQRAIDSNISDNCSLTPIFATPIFAVEEKRRACDLARKLLLSNENYLDRVIELWKIGNSLYEQVWDTEFHIFGVIESDTDHLPTTKIRELCSKEWQNNSDTEVGECISFYKQKVSEACNEILVKHGNA